MVMNICFLWMDVCTKIHCLSHFWSVLRFQSDTLLNPSSTPEPVCAGSETNLKLPPLFPKRSISNRSTHGFCLPNIPQKHPFLCIPPDMSSIKVTTVTHGKLLATWWSLTGAPCVALLSDPFFHTAARMMFLKCGFVKPLLESVILRIFGI